MGKNKGLKFIILPILFIIVASIGYYFYYQVSVGSNDKNIQFVKDHINSAGKLVDFKDEISVKSADDIKLFITSDYVEIDFGRIIFKWSIEEFATKEVKEQLESIGFEFVFKGEPKKMYLYYMGEEVQRWVK